MPEIESGSMRSTAAMLPALPDEEAHLVARQRVFIVCLVLAAGAAIVGWFVEWRDTRLDPLEMVLLPAVAVIFLALAAILTIRANRAVELTGLVVAALFIVVRIAYILHSQAVFGSEQLFELVELLSWAPAVYLLAFLVLDSTPSLIGGGAMLAVMMVTTWSGAPTDVRVNETLVQIFASHATVLFMLFALSRLKDRWLRTQVVAETLQKFAGTDFLTGIANRRHLHSMLTKERGRAIRHEQRLSVILLDLDRFKSINDRFGHDTGDQVLKEVAELLARETRTIDSFGRWGGEEFLVVLPHTDLESGEVLAERLRAALQDSNFASGEPVTASFGVAELGEEETIGRLLRRADEGLMRAKKHGRNRVVAIEIGEDPDTTEGLQPLPTGGQGGGHL